MRLSPADFWRLGLLEWRWLAGPDAGAEPLDRAGLEALLHLYPDQTR